MHSSLPNLSENIRWSLDLRYNLIGQPTGRAWFPGFIARSKSKPESEMNDSSIWKMSWERARENLTRTPPSSFQRWSEDDPNCA